MTEDFLLRPGSLTLADLGRAAAGRLGKYRLDAESWRLVDPSHAVIERAIRDKRRTYGVNTGFGPLSATAIPDEKLADMQRRMILSHCVGTGPLIDEATVRQILLLKLNMLLMGRSGVSRGLIEALVAFCNAGLLPAIPVKGSVGASGDLAPLGHLAAPLIGAGEVLQEGRAVPAVEALKRAGLAPYRLGPKEGLALVNGTQVSLALALKGLAAAESLFAAAVVAGALTTEAALGSDMPFDDRIQAMRGQRGQAAVAPAYTALFAGSAMREAHRGTGKAQDPYSIRCQPQIMGACHDLMGFAAEIFARELNAISDNPIIVAEGGSAGEGAILYGGNFHGQPVAMAADVLALAIAEIGAVAERRAALLVDTKLNRLPAFLAVDGGVDSGFMVAQVAAAALASENKGLAHPASTDSLPTTAGEEDHVSMATYAARRLADMADNGRGIVAIELLAASQGIEFRRPLTMGPALERVQALIRTKVPAYREDRYMRPDIEAVKSLIAAGAFREFLPKGLLATA